MARGGLEQKVQDLEAQMLRRVQDQEAQMLRLGPEAPSQMPPVLEDLEERVHRLELRVQDLEAQMLRVQTFETRLLGLENTIIRWQSLQDLLNGLTILCATFAANFSIWHAGVQEVLPG